MNRRRTPRPANGARSVLHIIALSALGAVGCDGAARPAPATSALSPAAHRAASIDGAYLVAWEPIGGSIPDAEPFSIALEIRRADGAALSESAVVLVDAEMPHHGHGMNLVPTVRRAEAPGAFVADGLLLHMPGRWIVAIDVEEDGVLERAQWVLDVE